MFALCEQDSAVRRRGDPRHGDSVSRAKRGRKRERAVGVLDPVERVFGAVNATVFRQVNRARNWWELPTPAALLNLRAHRDDLRSSNLYDTRPPSNGAALPLSELPKYRTYDGSYQDPTDPEMGMVGSRFGRNAPPEATTPESPDEQLEPSPREVSVRLLSR